jgi:hypothetical protein
MSEKRDNDMNVVERILRLVGTPFLIFLIVLVVLLLYTISKITIGVDQLIAFSSICGVVLIFAGLAFVIEMQKRQLGDQKQRLDYEHRTIDALKGALRDTRDESLSPVDEPGVRQAGSSGQD